MTQSCKSSVTGLVLVDHGSPRDAANEMILQLARAAQAAVGTETVVRGAHMECSAPSLAQAIAECVSEGAQSVFVQPVFLVPGRHATNDIPALLARAAEDYPAVSFTMGSVIGADPLLVRLVSQRFVHWQVAAMQAGSDS